MQSRTAIYSTISIAAIEELLRANYDLGESIECSLFHRGLNDTYRVKAGDSELAVRLYRHRWRSEEAIRAEVATLLHLDAKGVALAAPFATTRSDWLAPVQAPEGQRWAVAFRWMPGSYPEYANAAHARQYGELAARLHIAGDSLPCGIQRTPIDVNYLLERPVATLRPLLKSRPRLMSRFDALVDRVSARLEHSRGRLWDWGLCHGDLHGANAHLEGDRLALFDFDCCGPGWRLYDLATYRWAARVRQVATQAWAPFSEAYLLTRPEAHDTLESVPLFVVLRHIWLHGYYAWNAVEAGSSYQSDRYCEDLVSFLEQLESEPL